MIKITEPVGSSFSRPWEKKIRALLLFALSFLLPALAMLAVYAGEGFYPFGEKSLLTADMYGQYTCFLSYLKDMAANGNDFFYTFSKSLGGDMFGFSAYYLFSPFNLVALFFPTRALPQAVMLITLLKVGTAGLTFFLFLRGESGLRRGGLLFSTGYALMAYSFVYQQNIIWLDAVCFLPLVLLGIHRLISLKKPLLYIFSLALSLAVNYYTGYFLCLFSLLFFAAKALIFHPLRTREGRRSLLFSSLRFALSSLAAGGLSALVLLPTALSLSGGSKSAPALSSLNFTVRHTLPALLSKLYTGSFENTDLWSSNIPSVFCGILPLCLALLFFLNKKISRKEKLAGGALLSAMAVSDMFQIFYLLWHGFNFPVGFPCRQAFLFSFVLLWLASRCYARKEGLTLPHFLISLASFGVLTLLVLRRKTSYLTGKSLLSDFLLFLLFSVLLFLLFHFPQKKKLGALLFTLLLLFETGNLMQNGASTLEGIPYYSQQDFTAAVDPVSPLIDWVKAQDSDFYRLEKNFQRDHNDPMLYSYRGLSHFSSTEKTATKSFLGALGFRNNGTWAYYHNGSTIAVDSLLGVKYLLSRGLPNRYYLPLETQNGITVYENPYALPLAFSASSQILSGPLAGDNPFLFQNGIFSSALGEEVSLFLPVGEVTRELNGLTEVSPGHFQRDGTGVVTFRFTCERSDPLYLYLPTTRLRRANLKINGRNLGNYFDIRRYDAVCLGEFPVGKELTLTVTALESELYFSDVYLYYQDMALTESVTSRLKESPYSIDSFTSSRLVGRVTATEELPYLLTTIPADEGWEVTVDGVKTSPVKVFGTLLAVPLTPGEHTVTLRYLPRGFLPGLAVSSLTLLGILLYIILWQRRRRRGRRGAPKPARANK